MTVVYAIIVVVGCLMLAVLRLIETRWLRRAVRRGTVTVLARPRILPGEHIELDGQPFEVVTASDVTLTVRRVTAYEPCQQEPDTTSGSIAPDGIYGALQRSLDTPWKGRIP